MPCNKHWWGGCRAEHKLTYPLVFLTPVAYNTLKFAQSQLEWLNDALARAFEHTRENPFACRHVMFFCCYPSMLALQTHVARQRASCIV